MPLKNFPLVLFCEDLSAASTTVDILIHERRFDELSGFGGFMLHS